MISGRLHTIDEYLGLNQKKTGPESNSSSNQMLLSASSDKEFTKYVHGLDLLAHELYHPKKLLLSVKKEYMEWIQQATMELKSKTEEKEVRKKTVEQFNKLAKADSLHNMNAFVAPSAPSAPSHCPFSSLCKDHSRCLLLGKSTHEYSMLLTYIFFHQILFSNKQVVLDQTYSNMHFLNAFLKMHIKNAFKKCILKMFFKNVF